VAELVDALDLGSSIFGVRVRVSPSALFSILVFISKQGQENIVNMRGRKVRIARNTLSYTGRNSKPRMSRRRALPAHFLAPDDSLTESSHPSTVYPGLVDDFEEENADLPEIAYFWD
jgi:hypothetical protein